MEDASGKEKRAGILQAVTSPLGFFVLSLLIVESFIAVVVIGSGVSELAKIVFITIGIIIFLLLVSLVSLFTWFRPGNLVFDGPALLKSVSADAELHHMHSLRLVVSPGTASKEEVERVVELFGELGKSSDAFQIRAANGLKGM